MKKGQRNTVAVAPPTLARSFRPTNDNLIAVTAIDPNRRRHQVHGADQLVQRLQRRFATPHVTDAIALHAKPRPSQTAAQLNAAILSATGKAVAGGCLNVSTY
jgi:hypothetical protein